MKKKFLITGSTSGLGFKLCKKLDKSKNELYLFAQSEKKINDLKKTLKHKHKFFKLDFNKPKNIKKVLSNILNEKTKFEGLIHCAGNYVSKPFLTLNLDEDIIKSTNISLISPIILTQEIARKHLNKGSKIIFISSASAMKVSPSLGIYSALKISLINLTKCLAQEFSKKGIRVNSISPSLIKSETLNDLKKKLTRNQYNKLKDSHLGGFGNYSDVINVIIFLLSNKSKWITGSNIVVDGGYSNN